MCEAPRRPALAIDLGCGPGDTTQLVAETVRPERLVGLDVSEAFLAQARLAVPAAEFAVADLRIEALPPADLAYARYLVSHLADPEVTVETWRSSLAPGGRLLVEENLALRIDHPTFQRYEHAVAQVVGSGGGDLYVGLRLADRADRRGRRTVNPPAGVVARMFRLNLVAWGGHPAAEDLDVEALSADLAALEASDQRGLLTFEMAQLVFAR